MSDLEERILKIRADVESLASKYVSSSELGPVRFDFGEAVRRLKSGKAVARAGWNGKKMFLVLTAPYHYNATISLPETIVMRTAQGDWVAWVPSQTDVLATDWDEEGF